MCGCGTPRWILAQTWRERGSCGRNYLLKLVKLCQYNSQIHRVPAGRIVTNKQTLKQEQQPQQQCKMLTYMYSRVQIIIFFLMLLNLLMDLLQLLGFDDALSTT
jgi:hypothetical protein